MPTIFLPFLWEETSVVICDLRSSILHAWILMAFDDTSSPGLRLLAPRPRRRHLGRRSLRLASALAHTTTRHLEVHPGSPEPKPFGMTPLLVPTTSTKASYIYIYIDINIDRYRYTFIHIYIYIIYLKQKIYTYIQYILLYIFFPLVLLYVYCILRVI